MCSLPWAVAQGKIQLLKDALGKANSNVPKPEEKSPHVNEVGSQIKPISVLNSYEKKERPWGKEEIEMLRKGMEDMDKNPSLEQYIGNK
ncbi:uncharacterized protein A4U43_C01F8080 [Asparagus officinalis]|uniref:Uncharacterized protein n=1 Tax=Asparagus officinalis TaxID=4686 RepID=A0A5P1FMT2_ASPOF|nr:uncharacterized protein A4U43_C01F8080 [Asparagus officinalis]